MILAAGGASIDDGRLWPVLVVHLPLLIQSGRRRMAGAGDANPDDKHQSESQAIACESVALHYYHSPFEDL